MKKACINIPLLIFALLVFDALAYIFAVQPWISRWGASAAELSRTLPGDELVPAPQINSTHAITIHASVEQVWPWIVQMGQGRGGLYSYEELENLAGCDIHNAGSILPEYQTLNVGDKIRLGPDGYPFYVVRAVENQRALVLGSPSSDAAYGGSWVFYLESIDAQTTRLLVRSRGAYENTPGNFFIWRVMTEPLSFIMEQKMMRGIQERAEGKNISLW